MKWRAPIKDQTWRGPVVTWDSIKDSFPGIHSPEEAIRRTAKRCVKLGLIKLSTTPALTDSQMESLRRKANYQGAKERSEA